MYTQDGFYLEEFLYDQMEGGGKEKKSLLARVSYYNNSLRKFFERNWFKLDYVYIWFSDWIATILSKAECIFYC